MSVGMGAKVTIPTLPPCVEDGVVLPPELLSRLGVLEEGLLVLVHAVGLAAAVEKPTDAGGRLCNGEAERGGMTDRDDCCVWALAPPTIELPAFELAPPDSRDDFLLLSVVGVFAIRSLTSIGAKGSMMILMALLVLYLVFDLVNGRSSDASTDGLLWECFFPP